MDFSPFQKNSKENERLFYTHGECWLNFIIRVSRNSHASQLRARRIETMQASRALYAQNLTDSGVSPSRTEIFIRAAENSGTTGTASLVGFEGGNYEF